MESGIFYTLLLSGLSTGIPHHYHFVKDLMNWSDARSHCRQTYTDLATVEHTADTHQLANVVAESGAVVVWIGLYDDVNGWKWSGSEDKHEEAPFRPWERGQPGNAANQRCAQVAETGEWFDDYCSLAYPFVCSTESNMFVHMSQKKTWNDAQSYCRQHHTDLAIVTNQAENQEIQKMVVSGSWVWIGLYRDHWKWSDGSNGSYRNWGYNQPSGTASCALSNNVSGAWYNRDCAKALSFVCYSVPVKKQVVQITLSQKETDVNLKDDAVVEGFMQQIERKLRENLVTEDVRLTWRTKADGSVFHEEDKCDKNE